jgi:hypothetical protein
MRILVLALALTAVGATAPAAQTPAAPAAVAAPAAPLGPPRGFQGYAQPDIGASACRTVSAQQTNCVLPPMTAGRYLVEASGTSTALAAGAVQKMGIIVGQTNCGTAERKPNPAKPWVVGQAKTIKLQCEIQVLTDRPLTISVFYADDKATKLATGPTLTVKRLPWDGVLSSRVGSPPQD